MKNLIHSCAALLAVSASFTVGSLAADNDKMVNAYGEPAGFADRPESVTPLPATADTRSTVSHSQPGTGGLYYLAGAFDSRNSESLGARQARIAAENPGTVTIGPLEVLGSGPTGPLTPDARIAARDEATAQVLARIRATDHEMAALKRQAGSLDDGTRARFQAAAADVAQHRAALRENLKDMRAAEGDDWSAKRAELSVSYNAYVQSQHNAEAVLGITAATGT